MGYDAKAAYMLAYAERWERATEAVRAYGPFQFAPGMGPED